MTFKSVLAWVYQVLLCQYMKNICTYQGMVYTSHISKNYLPTYNHLQVLSDLHDGSHFYLISAICTCFIKCTHLNQFSHPRCLPQSDCITSGLSQPPTHSKLRFCIVWLIKWGVTDIFVRNCIDCEFIMVEMEIWY